MSKRTADVAGLSEETSSDLKRARAEVKVTAEMNGDLPEGEDVKFGWFPDYVLTCPRDEKDKHNGGKGTVLRFHVSKEILSTSTYFRGLLEEKSSDNGTHTLSGHTEPVAAADMRLFLAYLYTAEKKPDHFVRSVLGLDGNVSPSLKQVAATMESVMKLAHRHGFDSVKTTATEAWFAAALRKPHTTETVMLTW